MAEASLGKESGIKRSRSEDETHVQNVDKYGDSSSGEDDIGPSLPTVTSKKKRRKLRYERLYVAALPTSLRYSKSLMHKDQLAFVTFTPHTNFLITTSIDGQVSFWKKISGDVEFVKEFKAHKGDIRAVSVSADGTCFATAGADKTVKIFDVTNFDLTSVLNFSETKIPKCICWVHLPGNYNQLLAVSFENDSSVEIWDGRGERMEAISKFTALHRKPITLMAYNNHFDCVVSVDEGGMIEYWQPREGANKPDNVFVAKSATDLFEFKKSKSIPTSLTISPTGTHFATFSFPDRKVRIFDFSSGKLHRTYDESLQTITEMQQVGTAIAKLEDVEFGRRLAVEKELANSAIQTRMNIIFDETGHFILYGSLLGTKVVNVLSSRVVKVYGQMEPFRSLNLALYQGQPDKKSIVTVAMAASDNPLLQEAEARDAMLVATGSGKVRFYMFTNNEDVSKSERDVQNEKPRNFNARQVKHVQPAESGSAAIIHTTYGDIHLRLFPEAAPKAVENFVTHAKSGYYNNIIFHRVIRKFMIQTGDPLGDGTGGESIWGKEFEDEFSSLKHDKPYTVSMANAGPNTNGSQFFITTDKTPWLDNKHTIFGRAVQGLDIVHKIENTRVHKEKPEEDIKIVNISVT